MKVCVAGIGIVGLPTAMHISKYHEVTGYDIDSSKVENARPHFFATTEWSKIPEADVYIICVNTCYIIMQDNMMGLRECFYSWNICFGELKRVSNEIELTEHFQSFIAATNWVTHDAAMELYPVWSKMMSQPCPIKQTIYHQEGGDGGGGNGVLFILPCLFLKITAITAIIATAAIPTAAQTTSLGRNNTIASGGGDGEIKGLGEGEGEALGDLVGNGVDVGDGLGVGEGEGLGDGEGEGHGEIVG